jgi:hypothetical protein
MSALRLSAFAREKNIAQVNDGSDTLNSFPKVHNAAWPGVVGKGEGSEPPIPLDTMLDLTAAADVRGQRFDGVDLFLFDPHVNIDSSDKDLEKLAEKVRSRGLVVGSVVAPVWPPTGGGSAMGEEAEQQQFLTQVRKGCRIARMLRELTIRRGAHRFGLLAVAVGARPEAQHEAHCRYVPQGLRRRRRVR